ncbi:MAG: aspartate aminotransferase family protein [Bacteroidetes bacterium]|nr:MAG: aspartate aminotransferase family protein [Bacteroidota bacterium]
MSPGYPISNVFYRRLSQEMYTAVRGEGIYLYDQYGNEFLDGSGGAFVVNVGHGVSEIADAMARQAKKLAYVNGLHFTNEPVEELAREVAAFTPEGLDHVYFLSSGSAATEAAIKLARQYWCEAGRDKKYKVIARQPGYHGNTLAALSVSGRPSSREKFEPLLQDVTFIPAPMEYRCPENISFEEFGDQCASRLDDAIEAEGPDLVAAFIAEPVIGASAGGVVAPPGYFSKIRDICDHHDVLFIADEVLTGMGRTGKWLAIDHEKVTPDILTLGKGLSGGYAPLSALVVRSEIVETIAKGSGAFSYNQTFSHAPLPAAAGLATIRYLKDHDLVARSEQMGDYFHEQLQSLRTSEIVGDVRGLGLLAGVEYVVNRDTKEPFPPELEIAERIRKAAFDERLIIWATTRYLPSNNGDLSVLGPPFIITKVQVDELVTRMRSAIDAVEASL